MPDENTLLRDVLKQLPTERKAILSMFYVEVNKNCITREIKRLELQIANLSRQLGAEK